MIKPFIQIGKVFNCKQKDLSSPKQSENDLRFLKIYQGLCNQF